MACPHSSYQARVDAEKEEAEKEHKSRMEAMEAEFEGRRSANASSMPLMSLCRIQLQKQQQEKQALLKKYQEAVQDVASEEQTDILKDLKVH